MAEQIQVLHMEAHRTISSGLNRHITRQQVEVSGQTSVVKVWSPDNADPSKSDGNMELISRRWEENGVMKIHTIQQQVDKRLKEAGVKVRKGQNTSLELILSGSHDTMTSMDRTRLLQWADDSVKWAQHSFGKENVVNATLHVDEETPHLHLIVVPIVSGESRRTLSQKKSAKKQNKTNKAYNIDHSKLRLSANDVFTITNLYKFHDSYAKEVSEHYGMKRGVLGEPGSHQKHQNSQEYKRQLKRECMQEEERLKELKTEAEKLKERNNAIQAENNSNVNKVKQLILSRVSRGQTDIEKENEALKTQNNDLRKQQSELTTKYNTLASLYKSLNAKSQSNASEAGKTKQELQKMRQNYESKITSLQKSFNNLWRAFVTHFDNLFHNQSLEEISQSKILHLLFNDSEVNNVVLAIKEKREKRQQEQKKANRPHRGIGV